MSIRALSCRAVVLCLALAAVKPAAAMSIVEPIAFGSWRNDPSNFSVGAGAAIGLASFDFVPTFEKVFADNATDWALNLDGHIPILALPLVALYVGGGVATYSHDPKVGDSSSETGLNLIVGGKASIRRLKPFGEFKYTTAGPDNVVFTLGLRFHLFD